LSQTAPRSPIADCSPSLVSRVKTHPMRESKTIVFALLLGMCCTFPTFAQDSEVFGGLSANADYVKNRGVIVTSDQKVSPFFSHGSGPAGFELSFKRYLHKGLGMKFDLSGY